MSIFHTIQHYCRNLIDDALLAKRIHDLRMRFEPPNEKNRWDNPLFRIWVQGEGCSRGDSASVDAPPTQEKGKLEDVESVVQNVEFPPTTDRNLSIESIPEPSIESSTISSPAHAVELTISKPKSAWKPKSKAAIKSSHSIMDTSSCRTVFSSLGTVVTGASGAPQVSFSGSILVSDGLQGMSPEEAVREIMKYFLTAAAPAPTSSTLSVPHATPDLLYELDRTSQAVVQVITSHQRDSLEGTPIIFHEFDRTLTVHRHIGMTELQRHRRHFVKTNGQMSFDSSTISIGSSFIDYLAAQL